VINIEPTHLTRGTLKTPERTKENQYWRNSGGQSGKRRTTFLRNQVTARQSRSHGEMEEATVAAN